MSNDFIPFAIGGSANVTPQATYAANTTLTQNGFQSGIAKSPDLNKVWRQSSIMAAVVAQFIANTTGQNAVDDGTTATLLTNLIAAVSAQSESIIGGVRNLAMTVATASATATVTADEIIVGSALGGLKYTLANFNKTINLATTGAGGMDTGTAPVSGYVAIYAIWNQTTSTAALLATNATSAFQPNVYGGANMPSGYTASALLTVVPTNASSQIAPCAVVDRTIGIPLINVLTSSTPQASPTSLSIASAIPINAKSIIVGINPGSTAASAVGMTAYSTSSQINALNVSAGSVLSISACLPNLPIITPQTIFYIASSTAGTPTFKLAVAAYSI